MRPLRRLLAFAAPAWRQIALSTLLGFLTVSSSIGLLATSAWIISQAALRPSIAAIQVAVVGVRFFGITRAVFRYLERLASHSATFRLLARLRVWFYAALEPLAPARLQAYRSGDLLSRIIADVDALEDFYVRVLAPPLVAGCVVVFLLAFLSAYATALAPIALAGMLALGVGVPLLTRHLGHGPGRAAVEGRAALSAALVDGVQGLPDLLACGAETEEQRRIEALSADLIARQRQLAHIDGLGNVLGVLIVSLTMIGVLAAAIPRVAGVHLATLALATVAAFEAIIPLPLAFQHLEGSLAAAERLIAIVEGVAPAVSDPPDPSPPPARYDLVVEELSFTYPAETDAGPGVPALQEVSFTIREGEAVAIVGPSGAGKSTLVNLLLRFWDYQRGRILLGGQELRTCRADDIRARIGVVTQHTHLFNTTLRENLLIARPEATDAQIAAAIHKAQLADFIAGLPQGYDTPVGEQGLALSGGERQRVAIARVLLKDAPLLILDEATASLDAITEAAIMDAIWALAAGRTTLIITHRLAGLERADRILVLAEGRIVERGTQAELLARDGLYRRLHALQGRLLAAEE